MGLTRLQPIARDFGGAGTNPIDGVLPAEIRSVTLRSELKQRPALELPVEEPIDLLSLLFATAHVTQDLVARSQLVVGELHALLGVELARDLLGPPGEILQQQRCRRLVQIDTGRPPLLGVIDALDVRRM